MRPLGAIVPDKIICPPIDHFIERFTLAPPTVPTTSPPLPSKEALPVRVVPLWSTCISTMFLYLPGRSSFQKPLASQFRHGWLGNKLDAAPNRNATNKPATEKY